MNEDLINIILKTFVINLLTYIIFLRILNHKNVSKIKILFIICASICTTIIYLILYRYVDHILVVIISYFIQLIFLRIIIDDNSQSLIVVNLMANAIVYIGFFISLILEVPFKVIFTIHNNTINFILTFIIEIIMLIVFFNIKRFKNGFTFFQHTSNNEYIDIFMTNISAVVILAYCLFGSYYGDLTIHLIITLMILGIIMLIMIHKTLTLYYKQKQLIKTIEDYEKQIESKDKEIDKISQEKFKISKLNHDFYNRQKSLELKVQEIVSKANLNMETSSELSVIDQINNLTKEYSEKMEEIKSADKLPSTDIEEIDDMFKYMQSECKKNNIDFKLQINGNIHHLVNTIIPQNKLVTLIGDHIRDAIIAVNFSSNTYKSIIAILGIKENTYEFCVYDTGIEFEIGTLLKLGLEPATTHKETGGTGIGFMTTFETLKETNASLIIEEKHEMTDNDYTKAVIIRFDGKHEYKIRSYRANKIRKSDRIIIEKI